MTLVPFLRTWLYCLSGGRTLLLTLSLARLHKSHGNMGVPGQSTEHNHLGLSPAWFPPSFPERVQNCLLESQPLRTDVSLGFSLAALGTGLVCKYEQVRPTKIDAV